MSDTTTTEAVWESDDESFAARAAEKQARKEAEYAEMIAGRSEASNARKKLAAAEHTARVLGDADRAVEAAKVKIAKAEDDLRAARQALEVAEAERDVAAVEADRAQEAAAALADAPPAQSDPGHQAVGHAGANDATVVVENGE